MLLDYSGGMLITGSAFVIIYALVAALPVRPSIKLALVAALGLWAGLQVLLGEGGILGERVGGRVPVIGLVVLVLPLLAASAAALLSQFRSAVMALPLALLIGVNITRIAGIYFVLLGAEGRMSGPFPGLAGWGDVLTGIMAVPLAVALARGWQDRVLLVAWNTFGLVDLLLALVLGTISFNGGFGLIAAGLGGDQIESLPWSLIPTLLVPLLLIVHGIVYGQLWAMRPRRVATAL